MTEHIPGTNIKPTDIAFLDKVVEKTWPNRWYLAFGIFVGIGIFVTIVVNVTQAPKEVKTYFKADADWAPTKKYPPYGYLNYCFDTKALPGYWDRTWKNGMELANAELRSKKVKPMFFSKSQCPASKDSVLIPVRIAPKSFSKWSGWNKPANLCEYKRKEGISTNDTELDAGGFMGLLAPKRPGGDGRYHGMWVAICAKKIELAWNTYRLRQSKKPLSDECKAKHEIMHLLFPKHTLWQAGLMHRKPKLCTISKQTWRIFDAHILKELRMGGK